ncbi:serine hydrolase domain-containing protein [Sphingobium sp.]|uniref:serine hydrolase domain-containing protein n=1 Tax=Sphingobium sp. TaxID=1912891 RepID=UPI003B3B3933
MTGTGTLGFCRHRLQRVNHFIQTQYIDTGHLPGAHLLISRKGEIAHEFVTGMQDRERNIPLPDDAIFRIYSMTKPVTSVAALMLVEQGLLKLDDPVSRYIPAWHDLTVLGPGGEGSSPENVRYAPMRIIDLFRHTAGLTYDFQRRSAVDAAYRAKGIGRRHGDLNLAQTVDALSDIPLDFTPGSAWNYSISIDVLGHVIECLSGQSLDIFLQSRIFGPLGMEDTAFWVAGDKKHRFTASYKLDDGHVSLQEDPANSDYLRAPTFLSGGGGLVSTAHDYHRFATMLTEGGRFGQTRLLSAKMVRLMGSNHLPDKQEIGALSLSTYSEAIYPGMGFGLGVAVVVDEVRTLMPCSVGEMHWGGMASTLFWADPQEELCVTFMTQLIPSNAYPIRRELRTLVYASLVSDLHA